MMRRVVWSDGDVDIVVMDSMSQVEEADRQAIVVAGSNGGQESGRVGAAAGCAFVLLNDAGVGKDAAGIVGLEILAEAGIPAAAVSHTSAEISNGLDMWNNGVISTVNSLAAEAGIGIGHSAREAIIRFATQVQHAQTQVRSPGGAA